MIKRMAFHPSKLSGSMYTAYLCPPGSRKFILLECLSARTIVVARVYDQQFQGTILLMAFDFQGIIVA